MSKVTFKSVGIVYPGDTFQPVPNARYGDGIKPLNNKPTITRSGILKYQENTRYYYVYSDLKKYHASIGDVVIGKIAKRTKEKYLVDIGAYQYAELDQLAFENATKKSKPQLEEGDYVYSRVVDINENVVLMCLSQRKMEDGFGELKDGWVFELPQNMCRKLMSMNCPILDCIGEYTPFEIAVGINGLVWVRSIDAVKDVAIESCIVSCIGVVDANIPGTIKLCWSKWKEFMK